MIDRLGLADQMRDLYTPPCDNSEMEKRIDLFTLEDRMKVHYIPRSGNNDIEERIDLCILADRKRHLHNENTEVEERIDLFILVDRMTVLRTHHHSEVVESEEWTIGLFIILASTLGVGKTDQCTVEGWTNIGAAVTNHPCTHKERTIDLHINRILLDSNVEVEMIILDEWMTDRGIDPMLIEGGKSLTSKTSQGGAMAKMGMMDTHVVAMDGVLPTATILATATQEIEAILMFMCDQAVAILHMMMTLTTVIARDITTKTIRVDGELTMDTPSTLFTRARTTLIDTLEVVTTAVAIAAMVAVTVGHHTRRTAAEEMHGME